LFANLRVVFRIGPMLPHSLIYGVGNLQSQIGVTTNLHSHVRLTRWNHCGNIFPNQCFAY